MIIDRLERPLTQERVFEIWKSTENGFKTPMTYDPLKYDFRHRNKPPKGTRWREIADKHIKYYRTERQFALACIAYHVYYLENQMGEPHYMLHDPKIVYDAYLRFTGKIDSIEYEFEQFMNGLNPAELMIDPKTDRPVICQRTDIIYRSYWHGDPVLMTLLCRFTNCNLVWYTDTKNPMRKKREVRRSRLTKFIWDAIKRYCSLNTLQIKGTLSHWQNVNALGVNPASS